MPRLALATPIGPLSIVEQDGVLVTIDWHARSEGEATPLLRTAKEQLAEYFAGCAAASICRSRQRAHRTSARYGG